VSHLATDYSSNLTHVELGTAASFNFTISAEPGVPLPDPLTCVVHPALVAFAQDSNSVNHLVISRVISSGRGGLDMLVAFTARWGPFVGVVNMSMIESAITCQQNVYAQGLQFLMLEPGAPAILPQSDPPLLLRVTVSISAHCGILAYT
jgi:hypothetical protein